MAEAPGPPRKSTTYQRQEGMNSQRERFGVKPNEMFWLENVMRVAPKKLHSVPGPRQVAFFPIPVPPECIDATPRGQQILNIELIFDNQHSYANDPNILVPHSAYGLFVEVDGTFYSMTGDAQCAGGNMAYTTGCLSVGKFINFDPNVNSHPPIVPPEDIFLPAVNTMNGPSDEPMYCFFGGATVDCYYINDDVHIQFTNAAFPTTSLNPRHFAKKGDRIYFNPVQTFGVGTPRNIMVFEDRANTLIMQWNALQNFFFDSFYPTDNFFYALGIALDFSTVKVYRLDLNDGSLVSSFDVSGIAAVGMFPVNDDLIYVLTSHSSERELYYIENFTDLVYVGKMHNPTIIDPAFSAIAFWHGRLFFGGTGNNFDVNSNIKSFTVACPGEDGPIIATVDRVQDSIAAGDPLDVSWANILEPTAGERVGLYLNIPGQLGFNPIAALAFISTGGLASGSGQLTIPGGTTPGTYFVALTTDLQAVFMAKSDTFTVT